MLYVNGARQLAERYIRSGLSCERAINTTYFTCLGNLAVNLLIEQHL